MGRLSTPQYLGGTSAEIALGQVSFKGCPMTYNRRQLLKELDELVTATPRIRLSEIARSLGVDRHTIENAMRSTRSVSFREYKRHQLLEMARTMLYQPNVSIKEVGIKLGYSSAASFSRFVQKSTGKSPSQLRKDLL
jgi:transcriptional regulator GlxA family with amidase domain